MISVHKMFIDAYACALSYLSCGASAVCLSIRTATSVGGYFWRGYVVVVVVVVIVTAIRILPHLEWFNVQMIARYVDSLCYVMCV